MNVRRSISIVFVANYLEHGLALLSGMVLARWLTPEDFGIYSIAASVAMFGYLLRNFGVGQFIVQVKEITDELLRAAFSVTLAISWGLALLLILLAPWLGEMYDEKGVTTVLLFLSLNFFLLPFGSISNALLRREMHFDKLAVINVSAAVASLVVGLTAAWLGASYLSIAWAGNGGTLVSIAVTIFYRPAGTPWLPGLRRIREVLSFGAKVGAMDFLNSGGDAASELVIGREQGLHDLGIYSRAYGTYKLFEFLFVQTIRPLVLPFLSKAKHKDENLGDIYLNIITYTSIFSIPFFIFLGINAAEIIGLLYGDQWGAAVPVLEVLCAAGILFAPTLFFEQLLVANGRPGQALRFVGMSQASRLLALVILAGISLEAAAIALIAGFLVRFVYVLKIGHELFGFGIAAFARVLVPAIVTAIALGAASWAARTALSVQDSAFLLLLGSGISAGLVWLALVFLFRHPIADELRGLYQRVVRRN
jgi:O-antigen/teichoic acid export membrane protein